MFFSMASFRPLDSAALKKGEDDLAMTSVWTVRRGPSDPALIVMVSWKSNLIWWLVIVERDRRRRYVPEALALVWRLGHGGREEVVVFL
jgi:hypothetical protein